MALSGKPSATGIQVGSEVYFMYNNIPQISIVKSTSSEVTNPNLDSNGFTKIIYYIQGYSQPFDSSEVFLQPEALIYYLANFIGVGIDIPALP